MYVHVGFASIQVEMAYLMEDMAELALDKQRHGVMPCPCFNMHIKRSQSVRPHRRYHTYRARFSTKVYHW